MKIFSLLTILAAFLIVSCSDKDDVLPPYSTSQIFSVNNRLAHNIDTVSLGDSITITAKGLIADTTNSFTCSFKGFSGSVNAAGAFTSSGIQVAGASLKPASRLFTAPAANSALYGWTATYKLPVPAVAHKTNVLFSGYFDNSLSLSSQTGNQVSTDAKPIFVQ